MVKKSKPRAGSKAFWPRKRAKRIYPRVSTYPKIDKVIPLLFAGYKAGMVHLIELRKRRVEKKEVEEEVFVPATVIETPPLRVIGVRAYKFDVNKKGYLSFFEIYAKELPENLKRKITTIKSNFDKMKDKIEEAKNNADKVRLIVCTQPWLAGIKKKKPEVFEVEVGGDVKKAFDYAISMLGKEIKVSEVFQEGQLIDVIAVTKGKGTQGPIKRFGIKRQFHKATQAVRHSGAIGAQGVGRVLPASIPMSGQLGFQTRCEYNKRILKISSDPSIINPKGGFAHYGIVRSDYVLVQGSVPGPKKRLIMMRFAIRKPNVIIPPNIKEIVITNKN